MISETTNAPLIAFKNVSLQLGGKPILENINLSVERGQFCCIVGTSGCGKTTLLRLVAGLLLPSQGEVLYQGKNVAGPRRDVAIVFQDYVNALLPWRTVKDNVALGLEAIKMPKKEQPARIAALLERVGLAAHADKFPNQLSGGMQQRLQIARCLAQEPDVLLMDEPFGALDAMTRQTLQDEVLRIVADTKMTVIFVTHDLDEAIYLGDSVIAMKPNPGRILDTFEVPLPRPRDQLTTPEHPDFLRLRHELFAFIKDMH